MKTVSTPSDQRSFGGSAPSDAGPDDQTLVVGDGDPVLVHDDVGRHVGRYVVLEEAGRGAMGRVLRAYDPKLQREVALKELQLRVPNQESARATLVGEARAMAKLSHANVVSVFDVEAVPHGDGERLILVMEYVEGTTLRDWLGEQQREWQDVLHRFVQAGRGLAAAHQAGLLHRDFKPANVMVGAGEAKVTDFGLATPGTPVGAVPVDPDDLDSVVVGTPRYMAPEQHVGRRDLGPAIDQYAFCVALWEALCGEPPFPNENVGKAKFDGPPNWPRSDVPRWLSAAIERGLQVEPGRRFPSMAALLDALTVGPTRAKTRWRLLGMGALVVGVVAVGSRGARTEAPCRGAEAKLAGAWDDARRQEVEQAIRATEAAWSEAAWRRASAVLDDYASAWATMHTDACEATSVRKEQSAAVLDLRMACLQRARTDLVAVTDVLGSADLEVVERVHDVLESLPPLARCADIETLQAGVEPADEDEADAVAEIERRLAQAKAERKAGRYEQAKTAADEAESLAVSLSYGPVKTQLEFEMGKVLDALGEFEPATERLQRAVALAAEHRQFELLSSASSSLMMILGYRLQKPEEALRYEALVEGLAKGDPVREATLHSMLGSIAQRQGRFADAASEFGRALELELAVRDGPNARVADFRSNLSLALSGQGMFAEAESELRQAQAIFEATMGPEHPDVATVRNNLAGALLKQGRFDDAATEYRASLEHRRRLLGDEHRLVAQSQANLATALQELGDYAEAESLQRRSLETLKRKFGEDDPDVSTGLNGLAIILSKKGENEKSAEVFAEILAQHEARYGPDHPLAGQARTNLGTVQRVLGRLEEARANQEKAQQIFETSLGKEHPLVATVLVELARLADADGDAALAKTRLTRALEIREPGLGSEHPETVSAREALDTLARGEPLAGD